MLPRSMTKHQQELYSTMFSKRHKQSELGIKVSMGNAWKNVDSDYKPGSTEIVAFSKIYWWIIKQGFNELGRLSSIALKEKTTKSY